MQNDLEQLRVLNKRFIHNYVTNDVASHDSILHPAFSYISSSGKRMKREDYLKAWATGFDPTIITYWDLRDENIVISGDTALVRATNRFVESGVEGMACYTDVYVRDGGIWLCIHAQISNVAPENYPSEDTIICRYENGKRML